MLHVIPLPATKAPRPAPAFENPEKPVLLVVEDNEDVREYLIDCVSEQYQIVEAHNGRIGIEKAIELVPDLIISDVMMPEKDGFELCRTIKTTSAPAISRSCYLRQKPMSVRALRGFPVAPMITLPSPSIARNWKSACAT